MKRLIIKELHDSQRLHEVLETVNTMLTILATHTSPGSAARNIGQYSEELLKCKLPTKVMNNNLDYTIVKSFYVALDCNFHFGKHNFSLGNFSGRASKKSCAS